jgi:hypothetical protein
MARYNYNFYRIAAGGRAPSASEFLTVGSADDVSARSEVAKVLAPRESAELFDGNRHVGRIEGAKRPREGDPGRVKGRPSRPATHNFDGSIY